MVVRYGKSVPPLPDMHEINNRAVFYSARISFQKWERNLELSGLNSRRISLRSSFRNKVDSAIKPDATRDWKKISIFTVERVKFRNRKKKKKTEVKRTKSMKIPLSAYKNKRKKKIGDKETESIKIPRPRHNSGKWSRKRRRKKNQFLKISTIDEKKKRTRWSNILLE